MERDDWVWEQLERKGINPKSQKSLLEGVETLKDRDLAVLAMWELGSKPVPKSYLPRLKRLCFDKKMDIQASALGCVTQILGAEGLPFYRKLIVDPKFRYKYSAILALTMFGGRDEVPILISYAKKFVSRKRKIEWDGLSSPMIDITIFLEQFAATDDVQEFFAWVRAEWAKLGESERDCLPRLAPSFSESNTPWVMLIHETFELDLRMQNILIKSFSDIGWLPICLDDHNIKRMWTAFSTHCDAAVAVGSKANSWLSRRASRKGIPVGKFAQPQYEDESNSGGPPSFAKVDDEMTDQVEHLLKDLLEKQTQGKRWHLPN